MFRSRTYDFLHRLIPHPYKRGRCASSAYTPPPSFLSASAFRTSRPFACGRMVSGANLMWRPDALSPKSSAKLKTTGALPTTFPATRRGKLLGRQQPQGASRLLLAYGKGWGHGLRFRGSGEVATQLGRPSHLCEDGRRGRVITPGYGGGRRPRGLLQGTGLGLFGQARRILRI